MTAFLIYYQLTFERIFPQIALIFADRIQDICENLRYLREI
jgi:hypothetical protein